MNNEQERCLPKEQAEETTRASGLVRAAGAEKPKSVERATLELRVENNQLVPFVDGKPLDRVLSVQLSSPYDQLAKVTVEIVMPLDPDTKIVALGRGGFYTRRTIEKKDEFHG